MPNIILSSRNNTIKVKNNGPRGLAGVGVPTGGLIDQVLAKKSSSDFDTEWVDQTGGGGGGDVASVNGQTGVVVLTTTNIAEGTNLYFTDPRVSANSDVLANTAARHTHSNQSILDNTTAPFTTDQETKLAGIEDGAEVNVVQSVNGQTGIVALDADDIDDTNTTHKFVTVTEKTKLAGIEVGADVTDAINVEAAGAVMESDVSTASMSFVVDEDNMISNSDIKVPTQQSVKTYVDTNAQPLDSDLTTIASLSPTNNDLLQRKSGAWINRTPAQVKTDLVLTKADVSLGNVDNTADVDKPVSTATLAALNLKENTITAGSTSQYWRGDKTFQTLDKNAVGLGNVDNTSDSLKPISDDTQAALDLKQNLDSDLTSISGLSPSNDDILQRKSGAWTNRTPLQLKSDLSLTKTDVGLGNVPNTDATLRSNHTGTQLASTISDFSTAVDARISSSVGVSVQAFDADLSTIAALTPTNDDVLQRKAGAWVNRTTAQLKVDLSLTKSDVGLSNVPNTDATSRANHTGTQLASTISDFDTQVRTSRLDQMTAPTADVSMNSNKLTGLAEPDSDQDAATKAYVDAIAQGLSIKASVRAATTVAGTLATSFENGDTIDGVTLATGNRILIKDQVTASENGIYTVNASGAPTRAADADTGAELVAGVFTFVTEGTVNANSGWVQTTTGSITVDTTPLIFTQFSGAGQITAGTGMTKTGNTLDVGAGTGITVAGDTVSVDSTVYRQGSTDVAVTDGGTGASTASSARTNLGVAIGSDVQAHDATLDSLSTFNTNGLLTQTGADTFTGRVLTAGSSKITVTDGNGVAGNPTIDVADSTASQKGAVQITNDLGGTAAAPTVVATHLASALPLNQGGTASTTASGARTSLGLIIGTDVQAFDDTLASLASFNTNGFLVQTSANTFAGRSVAVGSSKLSVTNGDGGSGNPTLDLIEANIDKNNLGGSSLTIANGGTGQTSASAAFNALSPVTTLGDLLYRDGSGNTRLAGNTTTTKNFLTQTGDGVDSAAPAWGTIVAGDIPNLENLNTSGGLTIAKGGTGGTSASVARTNLGLEIGSNIQAYDSDLDALAGLSSTGIIARLGSGSASVRSIVANSSKVSVTNGDGVSGNPTIDVVDATTSQKGAIQLANDLGGTSASPEVKSRIVTAVVGKTVGDFPVSNYTDTGSKTAFQQALEAAFAVADRVLVRNSATPYTLKTAHAMISGKTLEGESKYGVVLQMNTGTNATVITNADAASGITTNVTIKNLTIDQQGSAQAAGGGIVCTGIQNWRIEDVLIKPSFRMNFLSLHQGNGISNKTGTATFTNGSEVVNGSGTLFTSELVVGDVVKSAGTRFVRVARIVSDTQFLSTLPWGYTTETGVTFKVIQPNSNNYLRRVEGQGTIDSSDAFGFGFCDYSLVVDCVAHGATAAGCGFVPDHARAMQFVNCVSYDNDNSGFSYETCEDILTLGGNTFGNGNGYQLISGSSRCKVIGLVSHDNVSHGFSTAFNITGAPVCDENEFVDCTGRNNGAYGLRIDGSHRNQIIGGRYFDNGSGGIILNVANSRIPLLNTISGVKCYDTRTTKIQARGIWVVSADQTKLINVESRDADHATAGITDTGTNTSLIVSANTGLGVNNNNPGNRLSVNTPITADSLAQAMIGAGTGTNKGLVIQAGGSTGSLLELQSTAGNVFANFTAGGILRLPTGTAGAPSLGFATDGSTGFYRPNVSNTIRITTGANDRFQIDNSRTTFMHGMQYKRTAATLNYSIAVDDYLIAYTALAAPRTATLPTAASVTGQIYIIKDESGTAATNNLTIATTSSQTIDGSTTYTVGNNYGWVAVYSNGTNWNVLDSSASASLDSDLTALANISTNGLLAHTGSGTAASRTLTAGSSKVSVTNGDGVAGNPTIDVVEANLTAFGTSSQGVVPASGGGTTNFLRADGTWAAPPAGGSSNFAVATKTSGYTLTTSDKVVLADATSGTFTLTLPTAVGNTGLEFILKRIDSALTNLITVDTTSSQTIDGKLTLTLANRNDPISVVSDGSNWIINTRTDYDVSSYRAKGSTLNRWYTASTTGVALTTLAPTINNLRAVPFIVNKTTTIDSMAINVTTLGASSNIRVGIYADNGNLYPGTLIVDAGSNATATTGVKTYSTGLPVTLAPGLYWLASVGNGTAPTIRSIAATGVLPILGLDSGLGTAWGTGWSVGFTFAALPSTFTAGGTVQTGGMPAVFFRTSS